VLIGLSLALLARAFYVIYVRKRGNTTSKVITWASAVFIAGFWMYQLW
jgi:hypothetical protein